jgi:folate-binding Fe-S cluster repair protein YgfZ
MLNLTALGAISFTKGCYPGQEIVARLRYRGTLKRRLYLAVCTASANPAPGDRIVLNDDPGQAVGDVVDAQRLADHCYLTAVIDIAAAEAGTLRLQSSGSIDLLDLPYALE